MRHASVNFSITAAVTVLLSCCFIVVVSDSPLIQLDTH